MKIQNSQLAAAKVALANHDVDLLEEGGLQIMSALTGNPSTIKQLALRFNLSRARVKFIVDELMRRGLVRVHQEVQEAGRMEIYYAAAVKDIMLTLNCDTSQHVQMAGAQVIINSLQTDAIRALTNPTDEVVVVLKLMQCRMPSVKARAFVAKLEKLAGEFSEAEEDTAGEEFAFALALYPVLDHSSE